MLGTVLPILVCLFLGTRAEYPPNESAPTVTFKCGTVEGLLVLTPTGKQVDAFLGIPYGEAPVGELRFRPPVPVQPWSETLQAKQLPPGCIQSLKPGGRIVDFLPELDSVLRVDVISEDCLKLNVWRPSGVCQKLPVMVWIHGGAFSTGSTSMGLYQGHVLAGEETVLVVTVNYRLGPLGFLTLGTSEAPGNAGLHDQVLALRWVKENVEAFGGDPDRVTVFGESAGSFSAELLMLSPLTGGLFQRAIMESGITLTVSDIQSSLQKAKLFALLLKCTTGDDVNVDCLQEVSTEDILKIPPIPFGPNLDGTLIPDNPSTLLEEGRVQEVDVIIGENAEDVSVFFTLLNPVLFPPTDNPVLPRSILVAILRALIPESAGFDVSELLSHYNDTDEANSLSLAVQILTDLIYTCPVETFAGGLLSTTGSKVYKYVFSHRPGFFKYPKWWGAFHFTEIPSVFGFPLGHPKATPDDVAVTQTVMKYWGNFAKYGDPNGEPGTAGGDVPPWTEYRQEEGNYQNLVGDTSKTETRITGPLCALLNKIAPQANYYME